MAAFKVLRGNLSAPCASCGHHRHHPHVRRKQAQAPTKVWQSAATSTESHKSCMVLRRCPFSLACHRPARAQEPNANKATASYGYCNSATPDKLCPSGHFAQVNAAKHGQMLTWCNQMHHCANLMQTPVLQASQPQVSW